MRSYFVLECPTNGPVVKGRATKGSHTTQLQKLLLQLYLLPYQPTNILYATIPTVTVITMVAALNHVTQQWPQLMKKTCLMICAHLFPYKDMILVNSQDLRYATTIPQLVLEVSLLKELVLRSLIPQNNTKFHIYLYVHACLMFSVACVIYKLCA